MRTTSWYDLKDWTSFGVQLAEASEVIRKDAWKNDQISLGISFGMSRRMGSVLSTPTQSSEALGSALHLNLNCGGDGGNLLFVRRPL